MQLESNWWCVWETKDSNCWGTEEHLWRAQSRASTWYGLNFQFSQFMPAHMGNVNLTQLAKADSCIIFLFWHGHVRIVENWKKARKCRSQESTDKTYESRIEIFCRPRQLANTCSCVFTIMHSCTFLCTNRCQLALWSDLCELASTIIYSFNINSDEN